MNSRSHCDLSLAAAACHLLSLTNSLYTNPCIKHLAVCCHIRTRSPFYTCFSRCPRPLPHQHHVMSDSAVAGGTLSAPTNLELKPEWPLFSSDLTSLTMFSGIPRYTPPPASTTIAEPTFTPADLQLIQQLRTDTIAHLQQHGITQPDNYPLKSYPHWRDIYNANRHKTTIVATPDPRLAPHYQQPPPRHRLARLRAAPVLSGTPASTGQGAAYVVGLRVLVE